MEQKSLGIGKLNILASSLAFLFVTYILVIYITLMVGDSPNTIAFEIVSDYAINWVYRFILVLLVYLCVLSLFISIPGYLVLKAKNIKNSTRRVFAITQVAATLVMLLCVILFWSTFGVLFNADMSTPFATPYRILEVIFVPIVLGLLMFSIFYAPSSDILKKLKKQKNKI